MKWRFVDDILALPSISPAVSASTYASAASASWRAYGLAESLPSRGMTYKQIIKGCWWEEATEIHNSIVKLCNHITILSHRQGIVSYFSYDVHPELYYA